MAKQDALIPAGRGTPAGGPVYQAVAAQFRALFPRDDDDAQKRKQQLRGWLGLALAHARAIDAVPMPTVGRAQTSSELREALAYIADAAGADGDPFTQLLEELGQPHDSHTPASHPAQ